MRCGQCHISIFPLCSIAQTRFGEVRFSEQETDLERKSLTFIYITQTFSTGNSWGSICLLLVLSYSLRILGTYSNNVISLCLFFPLRTGLNFDLSETWFAVQTEKKKGEKSVSCCCWSRFHTLAAADARVKDEPLRGRVRHQAAPGSWFLLPGASAQFTLFLPCTS